MRQAAETSPAPPYEHDGCPPTTERTIESLAANDALAAPGLGERPATPDQRRAIRILIVQAQLSDGEVERLLKARFSRPAVTQLSYGQAACLLRELQRKLRQQTKMP